MCQRYTQVCSCTDARTTLVVRAGDPRTGSTQGGISGYNKKSDREGGGGHAPAGVFSRLSQSCRLPQTAVVWPQLECVPLSDHHSVARHDGSRSAQCDIGCLPDCQWQCKLHVCVCVVMYLELNSTSCAAWPACRACMCGCRVCVALCCMRMCASPQVCLWGEWGRELLDCSCQVSCVYQRVNCNNYS